MNWIMKYITFLFLFVGMSVRGLAQETILPAIQKQKAVLKCHPEDTKALKELCFLYLYKSDYRKAIEYGEKLFQLGYKSKTISSVSFTPISGWGRHTSCWGIPRR